jgi:hypothetical protein
MSNYPAERANPNVPAVCIDCGCEFERSVYANLRQRCEVCRKARERELRRNYKDRKTGVIRTVERDHWDCRPNKCQHHAACVEAMAVNKGAALPCCTMPAVPVVTWDVTSEFDRISLVGVER